MRTLSQKRPECDLRYSIEASDLARQGNAEEGSLIESKKRKRNSEYADSAYGSYIGFEEQLAGEKSLAAQAKDIPTLIVTPSEPKQGKASSEVLADTCAALEPSIRVVEPDDARLSETLPLSFGHTKSRRNSEYADSAYGSSIGFEEQLAGEKSLAAQAKDVPTLIVTPSEPKQGKASSEVLADTCAALEPSIRVVEADDARLSETLPLPFGHTKSRSWRQILPSIKASTPAILGSGNRGAIELFCVNEVPTVCVTCWDPSKVDHDLLATCMKPLGLPITISKGKVRKSMGDEYRDPPDPAFGGQTRFLEAMPPTHGHYTRRPDCGASLGVSDGPLSLWKVSLGGYLKLKLVDRADWVTYAMTVHHILVEDGPDAQASLTESNGEDTDMAAADYDYAPGVYDGVLSGAEDPLKNIIFSSPAMPDLNKLISRLESRLAQCRISEQYAKIDNVENLSYLIKELRHSDCTNFGRAAWSSGLTLAEGVEVCYRNIGTAYS